MIIKQFSGRRINILKLFTLIFLTQTGYLISIAQELKIETKRMSEIYVPENSIQQLVFQSRNKVQTGDILRIKNTFIVSFSDKKDIRLPYQLQTIISYDRSTIIQYGDRTVMDLPKHLNVYWINKRGKEKTSLVNYYRGDGCLNLSSDGYTGIGGNLIEDTGKGTISMYSPRGVKLWETGVKDNRNVNQIYVAKQGNVMVVVTTNSENALVEDHIDIYGRSGSLQYVVKDIGIIQRIVFLGDDSTFFFQGRDYYGIVDVVSGQVLWKNPGKMTLVSPYGASYSPDGKKLFLVVALFEGKRTGMYNWKFMILDASKGNEIGSHVLSDKYPATWGRIFESVSEDSVTVFAGNTRIEIKIDR